LISAISRCRGESFARAAGSRAAASGKNILRLCQIRDAADNMPAVNAIKTLEGLDEEGLMRRTADTTTPGIVLRIVNVTQSAQIAPSKLIDTDE
jgi:hypothetical protein